MNRIASILAAWAGLTCACAAAAPAAGRIDVPVAYLRQQVEPPPTLSNLDPVPADLGLAGAQLGLADNLTTGGFLGHAYALIPIDVPPGGDFAAAARQALGVARLVVVDAPAEAVLTLADLPQAAGALILNATAPDSRLREEDCRANVLHTGLTPEMRADALMQVLAAKRWTDLALIAGPRPEDRVLAQAFAASARKFGLKLAATLDWPVEADLRRSASAEVPLFTQSLPDHDVLLVADEANDFARYVAYNTWAPRPLAGSEGMVPAGWARAVEAAGAAQLQGRFADLAGRGMQAPDYAAWAALRALGEAVTRTGTADPAALRAYMLGPDFTLAGFKGRPLTFRPWNGQLRQPVPVAHAGALVAMAPVEGFLHQTNELDTLGRDRPETACTAFGG